MVEHFLTSLKHFFTPIPPSFPPPLNHFFTPQSFFHSLNHYFTPITTLPSPTQPFSQHPAANLVPCSSPHTSFMSSLLLQVTATATSTTSSASSYSRTSTEEDTSCLICMSDFEANDTLRTLPCLHRFYMNCIDKWLKVYAGYDIITSS